MGWRVPHPPLQGGGHPAPPRNLSPSTKPCEYLEVNPIGRNDLGADPCPNRKGQEGILCPLRTVSCSGPNSREIRFPENWARRGKWRPACLDRSSGPSIWPWVGLQVIFQYRIDFKVRRPIHPMPSLHDARLCAGSGVGKSGSEEGSTTEKGNRQNSDHNPTEPPAEIHQNPITIALEIRQESH